MEHSKKITSEDMEFILEQGEGQFIEFKESLDKSLSKEIVAFANANGGRIFVGITDSGKIKGLEQSNKISSQIMDTALNCDPKVLVHIDSCDNVLIITVPESQKKPHACSAGFYLRVGANSQKLSRDEIFTFAIAQGIKSFDEELNDKFVYPDDFDLEKLSAYLEAARLSATLSTEATLVNLGVAELQGDQLKLNNAGVLFFAKEPTRFFLSSKVVCGEFAGNEKVKILDKKVYDEGILENIKNAINFVTKRIKLEFVIESAKRKEIPQFPERAYREAIVNAIMHRDYTDKSSDVFIESYTNKLSVMNPGGLVRWMKPEEFGTISKTRNTVIASLLSRTEYVEKMGTGIRRMNEAMENSGLAPVEIQHNEYTFYTHLYDREMKRGNVKSENEQSKTQSEKMNDSLREVYQLILTTPGIQAKELSERLERSINTLEKQIKALGDLGVIERRGSKKSGGYYPSAD